MSARDRMTSEQREALSKLLGDAQPARTELIQSLGKSVVDRREHEHPKWEDFFCLNLSSYIGERMAPVLRRLIDAERDADRYRTAWGMARTRALSAGGAADRYAARARELQTALQDLLPTVIGGQIERSSIRAEVLREAIDFFRSWTGPDGVPIELLGMASVIERLEQLASVEKATPTDEATPADLTVYRASHDSIVMGLYTTATEARAHCVAEERRAWAKGESTVFDWIEDEDDGVAELVTVTEDGETETVTGYVVTALTVAAAYDEEADE
jgi:hypothetical protein